ncbi:MAG: ATP-dependent exonuclease SbcCD, C subunit-like protein [Leptospiraceae bacterium]|nr:ATP-dependent exonuclease SbcCD, C subunit-like protein [Leptospiraceae bacterium]
MQEISEQIEINTGFRLKRLELLNWGTFHNRIWKIEPSNFNSLLTGDIGSGKSTLVDAITTLLVQHTRIVYNRAAGSEGKERTLYTYVRGEYKNEKIAETGYSRPVFLRDPNTYSVILGIFYNEGYSEAVSLAQVYWIRNNRVEKFFVVSHDELNISEHFTGFGTDILRLKKNIRKEERTELFDSFRDYSSRFRSIFGIRSEKAMDLFYQTVSMKSVGNLNDFVKNHMLDVPQVDEKIEGLKKNYENLSRSFELVQKAKRQLQELSPIISELESFEKTAELIGNANLKQKASPFYFMGLKRSFLKDELQRQKENLHIINNQLESYEEELFRLRERETEIHSLIMQNETGRRLSEIQKELKLMEEKKNAKLKKFQSYENLLEHLDWTRSVNEEVFYKHLAQAKKEYESINQKVQNIILERDNIQINLSKLLEKGKEEEAELKSLLSRKTQIPEKLLQIRHSIAEELNLTSSDLPFAGELLRVKEDEKDWEGAIERILRGFGTSLLVPENLYERISNYVNKTNLKGRLEYYRVSENLKHVDRSYIRDNSLFNKIELKEDSSFYYWLEKEILERYNYICCEDMDSFRREPFALSKQGQIKRGKYRHEKDDRTDIKDRRNYILGWTNEKKIQAIRSELDKLHSDIMKLNEARAQVERAQERLKNKERNLYDFMKYENYEEINWETEARYIQNLHEENESLKASSEPLRKMETDLLQLKRQILEKTNLKAQADRQIGQLSSGISENEEVLKECELYLESLNEDISHFLSQVEEDNKENAYSLKTIEKGRAVYEEKCRIEIHTLEEKAAALRLGIEKNMTLYKKNYPEETTDVDVDIASGNEFKEYYNKIVNEDLPRHEEKFKEELNEKTINDIAMFRVQLEGYATDIIEKVKTINRSLREIEYNPGTYIEILADKSSEQSIADFKEQLLRCLDQYEGEEELYGEEKFLRVKKILDRFHSQETSDINWTQRVTDVRNWYNFSVSERYMEDEREREHYSDSSGKSGGQKEKLAYTILASALAFQFGLEWKKEHSRSFRFVVIDEAFGRGSDESTRYGLELFRKLNLQLLIVTPLQKIHVIEDYIRSVHFVSNMGGHNSMVKTISIEEYKKEKEKYS